MMRPPFIAHCVVTGQWNTNVPKCASRACRMNGSGPLGTLSCVQMATMTVSP